MEKWWSGEDSPTKVQGVGEGSGGVLDAGTKTLNVNRYNCPVASMEAHYIFQLPCLDFLFFLRAYLRSLPHGIPD